MNLTPRQKAHLKALAHRLKPVLQIGKDGVDETVTAAVEEAFNTRELLKVKVLEAAPASPRDAAVALERRIANAHVVQVIGRTIVLYRPDPDEPEIELP